MKKIIYFFVLILSLSNNSYASSNACTYHNGIDCSSGIGQTGGVLCRDGSEDVTLQYIDASMCMNQIECSKNEITTALQNTNYTTLLQENTSLNAEVNNYISQIKNAPTEIQKEAAKSGGIVTQSQLDGYVYNKLAELQSMMHEANDRYKAKFTELTEVYNQGRDNCNNQKKQLVIDSYYQIIKNKKAQVTNTRPEVVPKIIPKFLSPLDTTKNADDPSIAKNIQDESATTTVMPGKKEETGFLKNILTKIWKWIFGTTETEKDNTNLSQSDLVKKYKDSVAYLECYWEDTAVRGSGTLETIEGTSKAMITTNLHIVKDKDTGAGAIYCNVTLPGQETIRIDNNNVVGLQKAYTEKVKSQGLFFHTSTKNQDVALIDIPHPSAKILSTATPDTCDIKPDLGDKVLILGYPTIGSDKSVTVTEGIISGYEGDYYVTDAKISSGNSGGVALLEKKGCYLGIPSFVVTGSMESLGRILNINAVFNPR